MSDHSLVVEAIVYLTAAVVCVPIAAKLRLSSVLGYLIAGVIIGPHILGFVRDVASIRHFAEFGVVMMLFVIGLELEPSRLLALRKPVFGGGSLQMAACALVLGVGALAVGLPPVAAFVAAMALALSSTALVMQTLHERGVTNAPIGRAAFGILLFQDMAAIPILALVPILGHAASSDDTDGAGPFRVIGAVGAVIVLGRYVLRPILRTVAATNLREVFTAVTLLVVLGIAQLMTAAGVSMALGAFLAGVLLAGSEYRHALETDIEPFKGLLLGLFFISVGMSIDFGLLAREPWLSLLLVVGYTALKATTIGWLAPRLGVAPQDRFTLATFLAQGSEFAFVVFGIAGTTQVLPGEWDDRLTLVVALSMALSPLLNMASDAYVRRFVSSGRREEDEVTSDDAPVILAGFGRFGQIVGRLLFASGMRATVLDYDPDQIDLLRRFGFRIFYGDPTRLDLLRAAGASTAKIIVIAVDDADTCLRLVDLVRANFPSLLIVARARNVAHHLALRERGVVLIERELFEGSLAAGRKVLEALGVRPYEAKERADAFRRHNLAGLEAARATATLDERIAATSQSRSELERQFQRDVEYLEARHGHGWHRIDDDATEDSGGHPP